MSENEIRSISDNPTKLIEKRTELLIERMKKDKDFSIFLDKNDKDMQEKPNHPSWKVYRNMLTEYSNLNRILATCNYYITKNV
jgi:hypothetical protein